MHETTRKYRIGSTIVTMTNHNASAWNRGELDPESLDGATVTAIVDIPEAGIERDRAYPLSDWIGGDGEWTDHARDMEGERARCVDPDADGLICAIVCDAMADAERDGGNWADYVDEMLDSCGIVTAVDQPDGSDPWEIVYLTQGRMVVLSDESAKGAARYAVVDRRRPAIDGGAA